MYLCDEIHFVADILPLHKCVHVGDKLLQVGWTVTVGDYQGSEVTRMGGTGMSKTGSRWHARVHRK